MNPTAQLPTTLAGEKHFIMEGLTDNVITLAANTLAAVTDTWDVAAGHRVQEKEDNLTPDLVDHVVQLTSQPDQHNQNTIMKVTDWTVLGRSQGTPTVTVMYYQHTW